MSGPIILPPDLPLSMAGANRRAYAAPLAAADDLEASYTAVRRQTEALCTPLATEDYVIQSMPEASPVKWHLAHTSWFFETFVLQPHLAGYRPFHPQFALLFNSYYQAVGPRWPRTERGLLSRPTVAEVYRYRAYVDEHMGGVFRAEDPSIRAVVSLGLNHEQQHQELIVTDLKHAWAANPLHPVYRDEVSVCSGDSPRLAWVSFPEGLVWVGHDGTGFAFDNESPRHRVFLNGFQMSSRLVTNAEYLAFIAEDGYSRPELWLSDGWAACQAQGWSTPLYWAKEAGEWTSFTLAGLRPLDLAEPVCHVSYYEADAFARWAGARLPMEAEWEAAAGSLEKTGHFLESGHFHPAAAAAATDLGRLFQLYGDVWQWTASDYSNYPGYRAPAGPLGEYNRKFMCNQLVLRGASCVTPRSHARRSYRNFFPPDTRWQFSGIRLARDLD
jgi:ergothioneine biosynthesis protein EgtB